MPGAELKVLQNTLAVQARHTLAVQARQPSLLLS